MRIRIREKTTWSPGSACTPLAKEPSKALTYTTLIVPTVILLMARE